MIGIEETLYRRGPVTVRGFSERFGVSCRGVSMRLQRVMVDFGADVAFARVNDRLREHYGFEMPVGRIRAVTLGHGGAMLAGGCLQDGWPSESGVDQVIAQTDGSMVPVVEVDPDAADRRRGKVLKWQEVRLCLAHRRGSAQVHYGGNFSGGVEQTGRWLYDCARRAGFGCSTAVHVVGDGAGWIHRQVEERFGANGSFLVDFMHLSEYLSAAGTSFCDDAKRWLKCQQARLKDNRAQQVLEELGAHLEPPDVDEDQAPVRKAYRYLHNRQDQVDYRGAGERKLPIGSGEVESGHRHVIQARLKLPGSWWSPASVDRMLALRLCRANLNWDDYWANAARQAN